MSTDPPQAPRAPAPPRGAAVFSAVRGEILQCWLGLWDKGILRSLHQTGGSSPPSSLPSMNTLALGLFGGTEASAEVSCHLPTSQGTHTSLSTLQRSFKHLTLLQQTNPLPKPPALLLTVFQTTPFNPAHCSQLCAALQKHSQKACVRALSPFTPLLNKPARPHLENSPVLVPTSAGAHEAPRVPRAPNTDLYLFSVSREEQERR